VDASLEAQRTGFMAAEKALKQGQLTNYRKLKSSLKDYPLYLYLEYQELRHDLSLNKGSQIKQFLKKHPDLPISPLLRRAWLNYLAKQGNWSDYLAFHKPGKSAQSQCHYLHALVKTGQKTKALQQVKPLWLHGHSRPEACDYVFETWRKAGKLTNKLTWQRIELAMQEHNLKLARYLRRFLDPKEQPWLDHWLRIHRKPQQLAKPVKLNGPKTLKDKILLHGVRKLARKDIDLALSTWSRLQRNNSFSKQQQYQAERRLALSMVFKEHDAALDFLDGIQPNEDDTAFLELRVRAALSEQDWDRVIRWVQELPEPIGAQEEWRYWLSRALEKNGKQAKAQTLLEKLTRKRSYYGFLAADLLGADYNLNHTPVTADPSQVRRLAITKGLLRARELYALNQLIDARREWEHVTRKLDENGLKAAAKLAHQWGLHDRVIIALAKAKAWDDLELRFPLEHRTWVDSRAQQRKLDSAWVFAVIRQESAFMKDAHSSAGALGLMQLMPQTARSTAKKLRKRPPPRSKLLQPNTNIEFGTAYLRKVLDELGQNQVLATAAYNAGPHRVRRWLPDRAIPADLWVATIPYRETRRYLRRVLAYTVIYEQRLGLKPGRLTKKMSPIQRVTASATRLKPKKT